MRRRWLWTASTVVLLAAAAFLFLAAGGGTSRSTCESRWTANANDASFDLADRERYIEDCMRTGKQVEHFR